MPLTLNVGLTKKIGLPDYGSLGASCHVAVELDGGLLQHDLDAFQQQVRRAFTACRQAVHDQLARELGEVVAAAEADSARRNTAKPASRAASNGHARGGTNNGAGANGHRASTKQLDYVRQLADQIEGLGVRKLGTLTGKLYQKPVADLSSLEASGLIDVLKDVKSGELSLDDALAGAAA